MTEREQQILALIREDPMVSQQAIADRLGITRSSVAGHIMRLTEKGYIRGRSYVVSDGEFVVVIGGANVDIHGATTDKLIMEDSNPGSVRMSSGGVARNVAENLARLDVDCRLISAVGDDDHGRQLVRRGTEAGIDMQLVRRVSGARTSTYLSVFDSNGELCVAVNDMEVMKTLNVDAMQRYESIIREAAIVVFDANLDEATLNWLGDNFPDKLLFADAVSAAKAGRIAGCLRNLHTLKCSRAEAEALTGLKARTRIQLGKIAARLHRDGVQRLFVTLGQGGVFYSTSRTSGIECPRKRQRVTSSSGAGDAFLAGIVYSSLNDWSLKKSLRFGLAAADLTLDTVDSSSSMLTVASVGRTLEGRHAR